jgi:hypothetical protein
MKQLTTLATALLMAGGMAFAGIASADFTANMSRISPDTESGSGDTVRGECGGGEDGFDSASATITSEQDAGTTKVKIKIKNGKPNTLYTSWIRLRGNDQQGNSFGGSPITGGGATPLAASTNLDALTAAWIGPGTPTSSNSFTTDMNGRGQGTFILDFPLESGGYPFNNISAASLADAQVKRPAALATPTAIVDPRQSGVSGPFLIRTVSHCQDGLSHGLSPANRESWFQYP